MSQEQQQLPPKISNQTSDQPGNRRAQPEQSAPTTQPNQTDPTMQPNEPSLTIRPNQSPNQPSLITQPNQTDPIMQPNQTGLIMPPVQSVNPDQPLVLPRDLGAGRGQIRTDPPEHVVQSRPANQPRPPFDLGQTPQPNGYVNQPVYGREQAIYVQQGQPPRGAPQAGMGGPPGPAGPAFYIVEQPGPAQVPVAPEHGYVHIHVTQYEVIEPDQRQLQSAPGQPQLQMVQPQQRMVQPQLQIVHPVDSRGISNRTPYVPQGGYSQGQGRQGPVDEVQPPYATSDELAQPQNQFATTYSESYGYVQPAMVQGYTQTGNVQPVQGQTRHDPRLGQLRNVQSQGQPTYVHAGQGQLRMVQPDEGQLFLVQPDQGQLFLVQPDQGQMRMVQPNQGQIRMVQPDQGQMRMIQPDQGQMRMVQPDQGQMRMVQPDQGQMRMVQADQARFVQPGEVQFEIVEYREVFEVAPSGPAHRQGGHGHSHNMGHGHTHWFG